MGSVRGPVAPLRLDAAIGEQRNSLRPTSARCSFSRSSRFPEDRHRLETPGPGVYDYPTALRGASAVMGTARSSSRPSSARRHQESRDDRDIGPVPDSGRFRFNAPPRATFGTEARDSKVVDSDYLRACPEHGFGGNSPGFLYSPDDSCTRPRSAPSYSMRRQKENRRPSSSTPSKVAPGSYEKARQDSMGVQHNSKRRTSSSCSFGKASRFPAPKPAEGGLSDECMNVRSDFGDRRTGRPGSGSHATFGKGTREGTARAGVSRAAGDRPVSANLKPPNLPHPPVAPRQEILRFSDNLNKPV